MIKLKNLIFEIRKSKKLKLQLIVTGTHLSQRHGLTYKEIIKDNLIPSEIIKSSKYLYLTGYLWDTESQKKAVRTALDEAKKSNTKVALSLSDPFCVTRHKADFKNLLQGYVSMVFCNQEEAFTLLDINVTQEAVEILSKWTETVVLTLGANGALISHIGQTYYIDPLAISVEDTTGAGDAFSAGFLYGMTHNLSPLDSGRIGGFQTGEQQ